MPVGMTIQLTFKSFAIEYKEDCSFDSLKVWLHSSIEECFKECVNYKNK